MNQHSKLDSGQELKAFMTALHKVKLSTEQTALVEDVADMLLMLDTVSVERQKQVADFALKDLPEEGLIAAKAHSYLWQLVLKTSIAVDNGIPYSLLRAEARQRQAVRNMVDIGLDEAVEIEEARTTIARENGWCVEMECRRHPTDCGDVCCWHCGRGHRANVIAAEDADED